MHVYVILLKHYNSSLYENISSDMSMKILGNTIIFIWFLKFIGFWINFVHLVCYYFCSFGQKICKNVKFNLIFIILKMLTTSKLFLLSIEIFILVLKMFSARISYYISSKTSNPICKVDLFLEWIQGMF